MFDPTRPPDIRRAESSGDRDACVRIRMEVFVGEQNVPPDEEIDGLDKESRHYIAYIGGDTVGTARVIAKGEVAKIGRVAVGREFRGRRIGSALMDFVLRDTADEGFTCAVLDSQVHAVAFYERLGFLREGAEFLDAGIPHYRMRRPLTGRRGTPI